MQFFWLVWRVARVTFVTCAKSVTNLVFVFVFFVVGSRRFRDVRRRLERRRRCWGRWCVRRCWKKVTAPIIKKIIILKLKDNKRCRLWCATVFRAFYLFIPKNHFPSLADLKHGWPKSFSTWWLKAIHKNMTQTYLEFSVGLHDTAHPSHTPTRIPTHKHKKPNNPSGVDQA